MAENAVVFSNTYKTLYSITDQTKYMYNVLNIVNCIRKFTSQFISLSTQ